MFERLTQTSSSKGTFNVHSLSQNSHGNLQVTCTIMHLTMFQWYPAFASVSPIEILLSQTWKRCKVISLGPRAPGPSFSHPICNKLQLRLLARTQSSASYLLSHSRYPQLFHENSVVAVKTQKLWSLESTSIRMLPGELDMFASKIPINIWGHPHAAQGVGKSLFVANDWFWLLQSPSFVEIPMFIMWNPHHFLLWYS